MRKRSAEVNGALVMPNGYFFLYISTIFVYNGSSPKKEERYEKFCFRFELLQIILGIFLR